MTDQRYFVYDPNGGLETFSTREEMEKYASESISYHLNDTWSEEVTDIVCGVITHITVQTDRVERPDNIDEEGCDAEGCWWDEDWEYRCGYELQRCPNIN